MEQKIIQGIEEELSGLYHKRPALERERLQVLSAVDGAQFITSDLRDEIHDYYNRKLARLETDISDMQANLRRLRGGGSDA